MLMFDAGSQSSQLRTELSALQSSFHNVSSELRVLEIRVEVGCINSLVTAKADIPYRQLAGRRESY